MAASKEGFLEAKHEGVALLARERAAASFNVRAMTHLLDGGEEATAEKERVAAMVEEHAVLQASDRYFVGRQESLARAMQKFKEIVRLTLAAGLDREDGVRMYYYVNEPMPTSLHHGMFIPTIQSQGTDEQRAEWLPLAAMFSIIGAYAQTELGHGSNVRGLETTATFDVETDEFVLNSPTLTSMKWWPGGLGVAATHCVTHARLMIDGTDYGVHTFIVQVRDLEDHTPLPGIVIGDIGPKFGWNTADNGYLAFDSVRIPRNQLLARYATVARDGTYTKPPHEKIGYGTMIRIRSMIVAGASDALARACTIAIRYSAVRRQGTTRGRDGGEMVVLDYTMQQHRLLILLATAYAFHFTGEYMMELYRRLQADLEDNDLSVLPEVHATSAGLKSMTTTVTADGIEEARRACGGHGFSQFSGLPYLYTWYVPAVTYEGDNVVLALQTARYLIKSCRQAADGKPLSAGVAYLSARPGATCAAANPADMGRLDVLAATLAARAGEAVRAVTGRLDALLASGVDYDEAWNHLMVELCAASRAHCEYSVVRNFAAAIATVECPDLAGILTALCRLYAASRIEADLGSFLAQGYLSKGQSQWVKDIVHATLAVIRPDAVALVDAFNFPDFLLNSALGRKDGDVYVGLVEAARSAPVNEHLRPIIDKSLFSNLHIPSRL
ncbi:peroxisomal acyl-coenzyme A oxidase 1 [Thecamonas trahens ATCC 50062]|uniref:Acyl-coenzyme A oxidase n=1 Tax=Thecamonas trahens ATCC 50062 TaxID=461836 RepID=A0A0L0DVV4_THETB|nr:peroxisomal acyl-coenzyme A oxidase 1 [Thecamonas trahens ATCC 50062]KNC56449.1 peroxisomal acyl-coenzyme A oxidase 1 [Thecamonas trahens ATCC 50062]|eukprot:XP_013760961.1 peroxisomal acyl-coenzyme A oxidase 1 [Thecamonas trahens ATCC 50062]